MASFPGRHHPTKCAVVLSVCTLLSRLGGNDAGARYSRWIIPRAHRWVLKYAPQLDLRIRSYLQPTNDSWRVDETYIKVKGEWKYLYRAVDSEGNTLDFMLSAKRDGKAAERFFRKVLKATYTQVPRVITVDKNAAYPKAIETLKGDKTLSETTELRQKKYLKLHSRTRSSSDKTTDECGHGKQDRLTRHEEH